MRNIAPQSLAQYYIISNVMCYLNLSFVKHNIFIFHIKIDEKPCSQRWVLSIGLKEDKGKTKIYTVSYSNKKSRD